MSASVDAPCNAAMIGAARFGSAAIDCNRLCEQRAELVRTHATTGVADAIARHIDVLR